MPALCVYLQMTCRVRCSAKRFEPYAFFRFVTVQAQMLWSNDNLDKMCDTERDERVSLNSGVTVGKTRHNDAFLLLQIVPDSFRSHVRFSERVFWGLARMQNARCLEAEITFPFIWFYGVSLSSSTVKFFFTWDFSWRLLTMVCNLGSSIYIVTLYFIVCYNCCL